MQEILSFVQSSIVNLVMGTFALFASGYLSKAGGDAWDLGIIKFLNVHFPWVARFLELFGSFIIPVVMLVYIFYSYGVVNKTFVFWVVGYSAIIVFSLTLKILDKSIESETAYKAELKKYISQNDRAMNVIIESLRKNNLLENPNGQ